MVARACNPAPGEGQPRSLLARESIQISELQGWRDPVAKAKLEDQRGRPQKLTSTPAYMITHGLACALTAHAQECGKNSLLVAVIFEQRWESRQEEGEFLGVRTLHWKEKQGRCPKRWPVARHLLPSALRVSLVISVCSSLR